LDYADTEPEFGRDFTVYRDEMRQVSDQSFVRTGQLSVIVFWFPSSLRIPS